LTSKQEFINLALKEETFYADGSPEGKGKNNRKVLNFCEKSEVNPKEIFDLMGSTAHSTALFMEAYPEANITTAEKILSEFKQIKKLNNKFKLKLKIEKSLDAIPYSNFDIVNLDLNGFINNEVFDFIERQLKSGQILTVNLNFNGMARMKNRDVNFSKIRSYYPTKITDVSELRHTFKDALVRFIISKGFGIKSYDQFSYKGGIRTRMRQFVFHIK
jgi:predicted O-methyltransferase YrrM